MKYIEVVHITWINSEAFNDWTPLTDIGNTFSEIHTAGLLLHQSSEMYLISSTYDPYADALNAAIAIPAKCVKKIEVLTTIEMESDDGR